MYTLEFIPDELSLEILQHLCFQDLSTCRIASSTMRDKIDRIFYPLFSCIHLTDENLSNFLSNSNSKSQSLKRALSLSLSRTRGSTICPRLTSNFTGLKLCEISCFMGSGPQELNPYMIKSPYFLHIVNLELSYGIGRKYFHRILQLTEYLQVLKLNSAVLGGTEDLFGLRCRSTRNQNQKKEGVSTVSRVVTTVKSWSWNLPFLREKFFKGLRPHETFPRSLMNLLELHLTLDYISPSSNNFSPFVLVENLNCIRELPLFFLRSYSVQILESKDAEQFYFTITSLLNTIPKRSYECLKKLSFVTPKCRQENGGKALESNKIKEKMVKSMTKFSEMKLNEFQFKIGHGYKHQIPGELMGLLSSQKYLEKLDLSGTLKTNSTLCN